MALNKRSRNPLTLAVGEALIVALGVFRFFVFPRAPLLGDQSWVNNLVHNTPRLVFGSSHLAQVTVFELSRLFRHWPDELRAQQGLHLGARLFGLLYIFAVVLWSRTLEGVDRLVWLTIAVLFTPVTVYFAANEEIGFYWLPLTLIGLYIFFERRDAPHARELGLIFCGLAAAMHGLGFFFLPALLMVPDPGWPPRRSIIVGMLRENVVRVAVFFGPNGVALLAYFMTLPNATITPGDSNGGGNGSILLPLRFRESGHYLLQWRVLPIFLEIILLTAPVLLVWLVSLALARPRRAALNALLGAGTLGLVFACVFNPHPAEPIRFDFDMYSAAMAPLGLGAAMGVLRSATPRYAPLARGAALLVSLGGTALYHRWIMTGELGVPGLPSIPLLWFH